MRFRVLPFVVMVGACGGDPPPVPSVPPPAPVPKASTEAPVEPETEVVAGPWLDAQGPQLRGNSWGMRCRGQGWKDVSHEFAANAELSFWRPHHADLQVSEKVRVDRFEWVCRNDRLVRVQLRLAPDCVDVGAEIERALGPAAFSYHSSGELFVWSTNNGLVTQDLYVMGDEVMAYVRLYDTEDEVPSTRASCDARVHPWQPSCVRWALFALHGVGMAPDLAAARAGIRSACREGGFRCPLWEAFERGEAPHGDPASAERKHACAPPTPPLNETR